LEALERDRHGDEDEAHGRSGQHIHMSALEANNDKRDNSSVKQTPAGIGEIYPRLRVSRRVSHHAKQHAGVVAEKGVTRKLGKEADKDGDQNTAPHARGLQNLEPGLLGDFHFCPDGLPDLRNLGLDEE